MDNSEFFAGLPMHHQMFAGTPEHLAPSNPPHTPSVRLSAVDATTGAPTPEQIDEDYTNWLETQGCAGEISDDPPRAADATPSDDTRPAWGRCNHCGGEIESGGSFTACRLCVAQIDAQHYAKECVDLRAQVGSLTGALEEARRDAEDAGEYAEEVNRVSELLVDFDGDQGFESVSKHLAAILIEFGELRAAARPPETPE